MKYICRSEIKRYLVDCIKEVLQRVHVCYLKKFLKLYTLLLFQVYDQEKSLLGELFCVIKWFHMLWIFVGACLI